MKRIVDIALSFVIIVTLLPIMAAIYLIILLSGNGPAIFRQVRLGLDGKEFIIYKFRSLTRQAKHVAAPFHKPDHEIAGFGAFIRKHSLDELPQLFNVLNGTMSLVGPRPHQPHEVAMYTPLEHIRLSVKPGMTGMWQVSGRSDLTREQAIAMDIDYVDNQSLLLDLKILFLTVRAVIYGHGAG